MDDRSPLDVAHEDMTTSPDDGALRLRFFDLLASTELFLLLETEPVDDTADPVTFDVPDGKFAVAFDSEARLAGFVGAPAPYVALSGRVLSTMLHDGGLGLALNLGVPGGEALLDGNAVAWLVGATDQSPAEVSATPTALSAPASVPEALVLALDRSLASAQGRAELAYLTGVEYSDGRMGHLLAIVDPVPGAEGAIADAIQQALTFSGLEAGEIDVSFFRASAPEVAQMARVGLRFDIPQPAQPQTPGAPGMNPDAPPKLR